MNRDQLLESIIELSNKYREFSHSTTFTTDEQYVFSEVSEDLDRLQERAADGDGEPAEQTHNTASTKLPGFEEIWNKFTEHWYKERVCTPLPVARQSAEFVYEFIARQLRASC